MESKLNLDPKKVDHARASARKIAESMQEFIDRHTTVSTERTILRLLGVDGVDEVDTPLPNVVVDQILDAGGLRPVGRDLGETAHVVVLQSAGHSGYKLEAVVQSVRSRSHG